MSKRVSAVLVAAGASRRFKEGMETSPSERGLSNKALFSLDGSTSLLRAIQSLLKVPLQEICIVGDLSLEKAARTELTSLDLGKTKILFCRGGERRQDSVREGLFSLSPVDFVLVHDAARPIFREKFLKALLASLEEAEACVPVLTVDETAIEVDASGRIQSRLDRERLRRVQTPQGFHYRSLLELHKKYSSSDEVFTDDSSLFIKEGIPVQSFTGDPLNIKMTHYEDAKRVEAFIRCGLI